MPRMFRTIIRQAAITDLYSKWEFNQIKSKQFDSETIVYRSMQDQRSKLTLSNQLSILLDHKIG